LGSLADYLRRDQQILARAVQRRLGQLAWNALDTVRAVCARLDR
jgi:hypothetical protein